MSLYSLNDIIYTSAQPRGWYDLPGEGSLIWALLSPRTGAGPVGPGRCLSCKDSQSVVHFRGTDYELQTCKYMIWGKMSL